MSLPSCSFRDLELVCDCRITCHHVVSIVGTSSFNNAHATLMSRGLTSVIFFDRMCVCVVDDEDEVRSYPYPNWKDDSYTKSSWYHVRHWSVTCSAPTICCISNEIIWTMNGTLNSCSHPDCCHPRVHEISTDMSHDVIILHSDFSRDIHTWRFKEKKIIVDCWKVNRHKTIPFPHVTTGTSKISWSQSSHDSAHELERFFHVHCVHCPHKYPSNQILPLTADVCRFRPQYNRDQRCYICSHIRARVRMSFWVSRWILRNWIPKIKQDTLGGLPQFFWINVESVSESTDLSVICGSSRCILSWSWRHYIQSYRSEDPFVGNVSSRVQVHTRRWSWIKFPTLMD